jgi:general secretion pathway protein A
MYTKFYNFSEKAFNITPDPKFLFLTPCHREALASMIYGINERKGFITLTGEVGTGKTTLVFTLLKNLNDKVKTVFIYHTNTTFEQLLKNILLDLDVPFDDQDKISLLHMLNDYLVQRLSRDEILAVIIDEAQNLPEKVLEEFRMLSNLETCKSKLLQIVLVGQPELEKKLNSEGLRQLKQRIGIRRQSRRLTPEECRKYIEHRLRLVGSSTSQVFTSEAVSLICKHSGGVPRTINILCDNALLIGYSLSKKRINAYIINEVLKDMDGLAYESDEQPVSVTHGAYQTIFRMKSLNNRISAPIILLICLCMVSIFGIQYIQKKTVQPRKITDSENLYAMDSEESKRVVEENPVLAFDRNVLIKDPAVNQVSNNSLHTKPMIPGQISTMDSKESKKVGEVDPDPSFDRNDSTKDSTTDHVSIKSLQTKPMKTEQISTMDTKENRRVEGENLAPIDDKNVLPKDPAVDHVSGNTLQTKPIITEHISTVDLKSANTSSKYLTNSKEKETIKLIIKAKKKNCIFSLAREYYHIANWTVADFILKANPEITNAHIIKVNQQIRIPEITEESLIIELPDHTYKIHVGTFKTPDYADLYLNEAALIGKEIEIIPRKVSNVDSCYRVVIGKFHTKDESLKTIEQLKQKGLLPSFRVIPGFNKEQQSA